MSKASEYQAALDRLGSFRAVSKEFGVNESTVRRAVKNWRKRSGLPDLNTVQGLPAGQVDPAVREAMQAVGAEDAPRLTWIKTKLPSDQGGTSYSVLMKTPDPTEEQRLDRIRNTFMDVPPVKFKHQEVQSFSKLMTGFIPLNDLHSGSYAWAQETGYKDWDLDKTMERLSTWTSRLYRRMPICRECILYFNGDTLHANDGKGMTPYSGNILDTDTRHAKVVDLTTACIIAAIDTALQHHARVRVVIKRGNHDPEAYLALLMGVKWRYFEQENVIVEENPSPYWAYQFGRVFLFGHHGDRVKPEMLAMKMAADHPVAWAQSEHRYIWTAHLHQRAMDTFPGVTWERASCITAPDAHGAAWGDNSMAQAIVYHDDEGEIERFTVKDRK